MVSVQAYTLAAWGPIDYLLARRAPDNRLGSVCRRSRCGRWVYRSQGELLHCFFLLRRPLPTGQMDHRVLLNDREFQNMLVEKIWIEDDMLRQYRMLEPKIEQLLETLNSEIQGRDE